MKRKIGIVTGDGADLPEQFVKEHNIEVVKYPVWFPDDDEDITDVRSLYSKMRRDKKLPQTSQPPSPRFVKAYKKAFKNFEEILVIVMSETFSSCISSAKKAREDMGIDVKNRIVIFDSGLATVGEGIVVLKAQEMIDEGKGIQEIVDYLTNFINKIKVLAFAEDLIWLKHGGRLREPKASIALALQKVGTRPVITIKNGDAVMSGLKFFAKDRIQTLLNEIKKVSKKGKVKIAISHADISREELRRLTNGIKEIGSEILYITDITPVVGAHIGPGTILIAYCQN